MQINSPQQQMNTNSFKGLQNIRFSNGFNPKCSVKDAEIVDTFMKNDAFNKLYKDYDAWASFSRFKFLNKTYDEFHLLLKEVEPIVPQKESFFEKLKAFFVTKNTEKKPIEEDHTAFFGINHLDQFRSNKSLKQLLSETTDKDLKIDILVSKEIVAKNKENSRNNAEKLKQINETIKNYV